MGCTPCKEEAAMHDAQFNTPMKKITTLDGLKRINSPKASFIENPLHKKDKSQGQTSDGPANESGAKIKMVECISEATVKGESTSKSGGTGHQKQTSQVSAPADDPEDNKDMDVVRFESEPSPGGQGSYEQFLKAKGAKGQNSPTNRNAERLAEWILKRQLQISEERKVNQEKSGGLDLAKIEQRQRDGIPDEDVDDEDNEEDGLPDVMTYSQEFASKSVREAASSSIAQETPIFAGQSLQQSVAESTQDSTKVQANAQVNQNDSSDTSDDDDADVPDEMDTAEETSRQSVQKISNKPQSPAKQILGGIGGDWRKMPLTRQVSIQAMHEHPLELSMQAGQNSPRAQAHKKTPSMMTQEELEEASWQCNGVELFQGGCKAGIIDFDLHPNIKVWRCYQMVNGDEDCDFDFCEMCVRWTIHCERTGADLQRLL